MICDLHFGDTHNDLTPVKCKWLPNDHSKEQTSNAEQRRSSHLYVVVKCLHPRNPAGAILNSGGAGGGWKEGRKGNEGQGKEDDEEERDS
jgi:hypothetical protein